MLMPFMLLLCFFIKVISLKIDKLVQVFIHHEDSSVDE